MRNSMMLAVVLCASLPAHAGFVDNPELPPMFKQLEVERPDGSSATVFVGDFDGSFAARKPLLIYLEGSGAMSHFIREGKMTGYGIYGLVADRASDRFHVATVDPTKVVLIGHSEGADVAAVVAGRDDRVTHVACLAGGGAPQFFDSFVSRRKQLRASGASAEEIAESLGELEQQIRTILAAPDSIEEFWRGHPYRRWAGFASRAAADELADTSAHVFVAQGSEDDSVPMESFDYLVVRLLVSGNPNVTIRRYPGRDHGFGGEDGEGGGGLMDVIEEVIDWSGR